MVMSENDGALHCLLDNISGPWRENTYLRGFVKQQSDQRLCYSLFRKYPV